MDVATHPSRTSLLFGADAAVPSSRRLTAGALSASLVGDRLSTICWGELEVVRAIVFVVRDTKWGTYAPRIANLKVSEGNDHFRVTFAASIDSADGDFAYQVDIEGHSSGRLSIVADGRTKAGLATCRTGFVVLHPLVGAMCREVEVEHVSAGHSLSRFPDLIDPVQPVLDIRQLTYEPVPGLKLAVRLEGGTFEMEDQRNWTDASYKTYFRPVAWGFPYRLAAGETVRQSVAVTASAPASAPIRRGGKTVVRLGEVSGLVPRMGLFLPPSELPAVAAVADQVGRIAPSFVLGRVDLRQPNVDAQFVGLVDAAGAIGCPLALEAVIAGIDPMNELLPLAAAKARRPASVESLVVFPARDLDSRAAGVVPDGEADPASILTAARRAFPRLLIGGGSPCGFAELNRNRPAAGIDFVTHSTQALFHDADDQSLMQTLEALPSLVRSVRAIAGHVAYRIAPATIGLPTGWTAGAIAPNPKLGRMTMAEEDPRAGALFGATFALAYAAVAAREGVDMLCLAATTGPFGLFAEGQLRPLAAVMAGLCAISGQPRREVLVEGHGNRGIAALAAEGSDGTQVWLANLQPEALAVEIELVGNARCALIDAAALASRAPDAVPVSAFAGGTLHLDAYAICHLAVA